MNVLFVASECAPFVKTGGLADVIGAVPKTLGKQGVSVRVLLPAYPKVLDQTGEGEIIARYDDLHGGAARLIAAKAEGLDMLLLDAPHLYDRPGGIYVDGNGRDWDDNHLRFAALAQIGARIGLEGIGGWKPEIVHAHDWQAGLIPAYLRQAGEGAPGSVLTIHNIAFQGLFDPARCGSLGIARSSFTRDGAEFYGALGFLKAGIAFADRITTVSPTYAREIMSPEFGIGLEGILQARGGAVSGILNGIDTEVWNPATDPHLSHGYSAKTIAKKQENRAEVLRRFGLEQNGDGPLFCVISRLTRQKGLDLLLQSLPGLVGRGAKLAVLGTGEKDLEGGFIGAAHEYRGSVGVIIDYDEPLSHLLQGGSDAILVPSRFEPCGLTQLYGLRYGTIPLVARTGGLADTVIDANDAALQVGCATGIQFAPVTTFALDQAIDRTCALYRQPKLWDTMVQRAMAHPVSWEGSAAAYRTLYDAIHRERA